MLVDKKTTLELAKVELVRKADDSYKFVVLYTNLPVFELTL